MHVQSDATAPWTLMDPTDNEAVRPLVRKMLWLISTLSLHAAGIPRQVRDQRLQLPSQPGLQLRQRSRSDRGVHGQQCWPAAEVAGRADVTAPAQIGCQIGCRAWNAQRLLLHHHEIQVPVNRHVTVSALKVQVALLFPTGGIIELSFKLQF